MSTSKSRFLKRFLAAATAVTSLAVVTTIACVVAGIVLDALALLVVFSAIGAK